MDTGNRSFIYLHLAVFLFGFTGILGAIISLSALCLVWWRSLLTWMLMLPMIASRKSIRKIPMKNIGIYVVIGCLLAMHWICFYGSIKLANASIAMICLAFISVMTSFFEAGINRRPLKSLDVLVGLAIIPGMWLIFQNIKPSQWAGFIVGILSALFSAIVATLNKKYIHRLDTISISWVELFSVWAFLSILLPFYFYITPSVNFWPSRDDLLWLLVLTVACTIFPFVLSLKSMRQLSAFSTMLAYNLEPVYGIILSIVILKEHREMNTLFYVGVFLILATVFIHPWLEKKKYTHPRNRPQP